MIIKTEFRTPCGLYSTLYRNEDGSAHFVFNNCKDVDGDELIAKVFPNMNYEQIKAELEKGE